MENIQAITKDQVKAIRTSDRLAFQFYQGKMTMRAIFEKKVDKRGWEKPEYEVEFETAVRFRDYGKEQREYGQVPHSCFSLIWKYPETPETTALEFIQAGDKIEVEWISGNQNGYMKDNGLFGDNCKMIVERNGKKYHFMMESSCCPNNSARMVKW